MADVNIITSSATSETGLDSASLSNPNVSDAIGNINKNAVNTKGMNPRFPAYILLFEVPAYEFSL